MCQTDLPSFDGWVAKSLRGRGGKGKGKNKKMELKGIEPLTSRMQSERSTTELQPQLRYFPISSNGSGDTHSLFSFTGIMNKSEQVMFTIINICMYVYSPHLSIYIS